MKYKIQRTKYNDKNNPNFGHKWTKEMKERQSELTKKAMKKIDMKKILAHVDKSGKNNGMFGVHRYGKDAPNWGKIGYWRNKKRPIHSKRMRGRRNPNWIENKIRFYPLGWNKTHREQIRFRDGYKCQICNCPEIENCQKLSVHHIDYNKKNINPENLISLCLSCHTKTNRNRTYWINFLRRN